MTDKPTLYIDGKRLLYLRMGELVYMFPPGNSLTCKNFNPHRHLDALLEGATTDNFELSAWSLRPRAIGEWNDERSKWIYLSNITIEGEDFVVQAFFEHITLTGGNDYETKRID